MSSVAAMRNVHIANGLSRFADSSSAYRGQGIRIVPKNEANVSRNGVAYFPFESEKDVGDWMESAVCEWWDDETV